MWYWSWASYFCTLWSILHLFTCVIVLHSVWRSSSGSLWTDQGTRSSLVLCLKCSEANSTAPQQELSPTHRALASGSAPFSLTGAAAHGIPLHTLAKGKRGDVGIGVHTLLHVAAPHALRAATRALSTRRPQGTRRPALLGAVVRWGSNQERHLEFPPCQPRSKAFQCGLWPTSVSWNQFSGLH